ncbi:hypothetical protein DV737_g3422, partial [Chaetothyriales sp. CBS 132003]
MPVEIRPATRQDLSQIQQIFEHYVLNSVITFTVQKPPPNYVASRYEGVVERGLPYLVAIDQQNGHVVGYTYAAGFRGYMLGYGHTVEISLFCAPGYTNQGIGSRLLRALLAALQQAKQVSYEAGHEHNKVEFEVKKVLAVMAVDETAPKHGLALRDWYLKFGFEEVGRLKGVGFKKGRE